MKEEVIKNVIEQVIAMLGNDVLAENGLESFEGWCENGDIFETNRNEHIAVMKRIAPAVDNLTNIIFNLQGTIGASCRVIILLYGFILFVLVNQ